MRVQWSPPANLKAGWNGIECSLTGTGRVQRGKGGTKWHQTLCLPPTTSPLQEALKAGPRISITPTLYQGIPRLPNKALSRSSSIFLGASIGNFFHPSPNT